MQGVKALALALILPSLGLAQNTCRQSASRTTDENAQKGKEVVVRVPDEKPGRVQILNPGDTLVLQLPVQPGTGYTWVVRGDLKGLQKVGDTTYVQYKSEPGAVETQVVKLAATQIGEHNISLAYVPIWDESSPSQVIDVHVKIDKR